MRTFLADTVAAHKALGLPGETDADRQRHVNESMLWPAVLDVARHPTANPTVDSALPSPRKAAGPNVAYDLLGTFTLHGVAAGVASAPPAAERAPEP